MNTKIGEICKKIYAILIVISLLISNFWIVGDAAISYAIDLVETNNSNVNFSAYLIDENGENVQKIQKEINGEPQYLYIDIAVKNEGYFNGKISFKNNNFNLKQDILSKDIEKIDENNVVTLKQINAGGTTSIKLEIEPIEGKTITKSELNSKTDVILEGDYVNGKNVEKEKYTKIEGKSQVEINWVSSTKITSVLDASLLTNSIYEVMRNTKKINANISN